MRKLDRFELVRKISRYIPSNIQYVAKITLDSPSLFEGADIESAVNSLRKEGFYLGLQLPDEILRELLDFASTDYCYGNRNPNQSFYYKASRAYM